MRLSVALILYVICCEQGQAHVVVSTVSFATAFGCLSLTMQLLLFRKNHARLACSVVNALTTARCRYQLLRIADRGEPCPYGTILISHSQTTAFSLFLVICLTLFGVIFLPVAKVILRLSRSDILFASSTAARQYHSAESRISLRSNRTRRKANRTEKSTCNSKCFFLVRETKPERQATLAVHGNNYMSLLLRRASQKMD